MDDRQFRQLLEHLGLSWPGYRKVRAGVKKRIVRHMQALGCRNLPEYLNRLGPCTEAGRQCARLMGVSISRFFRDRRLWEALERRILPELIETSGGRVRAWCAGCARGEEVYSLKILWERLRGSIGPQATLEITATDINPLYLRLAQEALYPASSLKEVPQSLRDLFFEAPRSRRPALGDRADCGLSRTRAHRLRSATGDGRACAARAGPDPKHFAVRPALKAGITWVAHDFFTAPPGGGFHLLFIRNSLLTYYPVERIAPVIHRLVTALSTGGYLITGAHEKHPFPPSALKPHPALCGALKKTA